MRRRTAHFGRHSIAIAVFVVAAVAVGVLVGVGGFTFVYAGGASYLTSNPAACANCHIMNDQYNGWLRSSHHAVAVCNDCHAPTGLVEKYYVKARNGWNHSLAFTTGDFHEPIEITAFNRRVTEAACRRCHSAMVESIDRPTGRADAHRGAEAVSCIRCHSSVGHMHSH